MPTILRDLLAHPLAQRLGWTLAHSLWQFVVVAGLLAVALVLLRRRSTQARYAAACSAMLFCALATIATFVLLSISLPRATPTHAPDVAPAAQVVARERAVTPLRRHELNPLHRIEPLLPWAALAWAAGVCGLSVRNGIGWMRVRALRRRAEPLAQDPWPRAFARLCAMLDVRRAVALARCDRVDVPSVIGWLMPVVLVPAGALSGLAPQQLEALLAHELAHVRRHDYLANLIQTVIETLLFYHPAVWWMSRVIRVEREHCCDDLAAAACGDRRTYAHALARMEELRLGGAATLALAASGTALLPRIRRLLGVPAPARRTARSLPAALIAVMCAALPLVAGQLQARQDSADATAAPSTQPADAPLKVGDQMIVAITDLEGPGIETFKQAEVALDGDIMLNDQLGPIRAHGLARLELERAIAQRIRDKGLVQNAQVKVTLAEEPGAAGEAAVPARVAPELEKLLRKRIPEVRLEGTPLSDVIDFFRDTTGANIFVNWKVLEGVGIDRNAPVTLHLRDVTLDMVLRLILANVGDGNVRLAYTTEQNIIKISVADELPPEATTKQRPVEATYYISGVERDGAYVLSGRTVTLKRALRDGGLNDTAGKYLVRHSRDRQTKVMSTEIIPLEDLLKTKRGDTVILAGDVLVVTDNPPATQPAAEQR